MSSLVKALAPHKVSVEGVALHHGLTAYVLDTAVDWSFLAELKLPYGKLSMVQEPSTLCYGSRPCDATVSFVDAANEAARLLFDHANKFSLGDDQVLALFKKDHFEGVFRN